MLVNVNKGDLTLTFDANRRGWNADIKWAFSNNPPKIRERCMLLMREDDDDTHRVVCLPMHGRRNIRFVLILVFVFL